MIKKKKNSTKTFQSLTFREKSDIFNLKKKKIVACMQSDFHEETRDNDTFLAGKSLVKDRKGTDELCVLWSRKHVRVPFFRNLTETRVFVNNRIAFKIYEIYKYNYYYIINNANEQIECSCEE